MGMRLEASETKPAPRVAPLFGLTVRIERSATRGVSAPERIRELPVERRCLRLGLVVDSV
jgi:hypothetical protein